MGSPWLQLLASHACTKLGSRAWEFVTPLFLLQFSDGSLLAPTVFGLAIFAFKFLFGPAAGRWMDCTERMRIVRWGIGLQSLGVVAAIGVLCLLELTRPLVAQPSEAAAEALLAGEDVVVFAATEAAAPASVIGLDGGTGRAGGVPIGLLAAMIICGCAEALGALVSSVAVKKDFVPSMWAPTDPTLSWVNAAMANIDLAAEMVGALGAGLALQAFGGDAAGGFVLVGAANVASFGVELLLLRAVILSNAQLQAPKPVPFDGAPPTSFAARCDAALSAWRAFLSHPSGIPLLVTSYAMLNFTALSPHGVILTAYLQTRDLSLPALAAFRAAGAFSGVAGMGAFRCLSKHIGLRRLATLHLWVLALAVAGAAWSFAATFGTSGLSPPMVAFLGLVVASRFGLYGFDLANLQMQQEHVDEAFRGSVGSVESSLCSLGVAALFVSTLATSASSDPHAFGALVYASAGFVGSAALLYTLWVLLFHEHMHAHPLFDSAEEAAGPDSKSLPGARHAHTRQQRRSLEESPGRVHKHLHFHPPWSHALAHLRAVAKGGMGHAHGMHEHDHDGFGAQVFYLLRFGV